LRTFFALRGDASGVGRAPKARPEAPMSDLIFLAETVLLFRASVWYARRCDRI